MNEFEIGDNIFHKSNPTIVWTIEKIDNNDVTCSTLVKDSYELKKAIFTMSSIEKCAKPRITMGNITRKNHY